MNKISTRIISFAVVFALCVPTALAASPEADVDANTISVEETAELASTSMSEDEVDPASTSLYYTVAYDGVRLRSTTSTASDSTIIASLSKGDFFKHMKTVYVDGYSWIYGEVVSGDSDVDGLIGYVRRDMLNYYGTLD